MNPTKLVALSFGGVILAGALLLALPVASKSGESAGLLTALFTATSATCVTGLVLVDTWLSWTVFGQIVILVMIQLGGLGFMTVITLFSFALHRRIGLAERLVMASTLNLTDLDGVVRLVRHALMGTFLLEGVGAVLLSTAFIPRFGLPGGLWRGLFHSVSAFCNAGFDLMGTDGPFSSLTSYADNPLVLLTVALLIIVGGLGFFVWEDVLRRKSWKALSLYSKMVLAITAALILAGAAFFLAVEFDNPATLGYMPLWEKVLNALFQSVTLRTAGFNAIDQGALRESSLVLSVLMMMVGGSSGSTAGGIKTATAGVLFLTMRAGLLGRREVTLRGRTISAQRVTHAVTLSLTMFSVLLASAMALSLGEGGSYLHAAFEAASAMGTVGLSTGITPGLAPVSRLLLICLMYLGRVGMLSFSIAFLTNRSGNCAVKYPTFDIMIG